MTYQGYTNYETFTVAVTLDNDKPLYIEVTEQAQAVDRKDDPDGTGFATWLKDYVETMVDESITEGATLARDLVNGALSEVDWLELAQVYLSELGE